MVIPMRWSILSRPSRSGGCGAVGSYVLVIAVLLISQINANPSPQTSGNSRTTCDQWTSQNDFDVILLESQADIDTYLTSQCPLIHRTVQIHISSNDKVIDLSHVQNITGTLEFVPTAGLEEIRGPNLQHIGGDLTFFDLPDLRNISLPKLVTVGGSVVLNKLPKVGTLPFGEAFKGVSDGSQSSNITQLWIAETNLSSAVLFQDISNSRQAERYSAIRFLDNPYLTQVMLPGLQKTNTTIEVSGNGPNATVGFNGLETAESVLIEGAGSLYLTSLRFVDGTLTFQNNTVTEINLNALDEVTGDLIIRTNPNLKGIGMRGLKNVGTAPFETTFDRRIGRIDIEDNRSLISVRAFTSLVYVRIGTWLTGNFTDVDSRLIGSLSAPFPQVHILSYNTSYNCSAFDSSIQRYREENPFREQTVYSCGVMYPNGTYVSSPLPTTSSGGVVPRTTLTREIIGVLVAVTVIGVTLGCALMWTQVRRKRRIEAERARRRAAGEDVDGDLRWVELSTGRGRRRTADEGVFRRSEEGERPPVYERVGKPGEVPPRYLEVLESNTSDDRASNERRESDAPRSRHSSIGDIQRPTQATVTGQVPSTNIENTDNIRDSVPSHGRNNGHPV